MKMIYLLLYSLIPIFAVAQQDGHLTAYCNGKVFTQVETLPSIKGGETALGDSLSSYFTSRHVVVKDGKATFGFILTDKSQVFEIRRLAGNFPEENIFEEGLRAYSNMWKPAIQNTHEVCDRVRLDVAFAGGNIILNVKQGMP